MKKQTVFYTLLLSTPFCAPLCGMDASKELAAMKQELATLRAILIEAEIATDLAHFRT